LALAFQMSVLEVWYNLTRLGRGRQSNFISNTSIRRLRQNLLCYCENTHSIAVASLPAPDGDCYGASRFPHTFKGPRQQQSMMVSIRSFRTLHEHCKTQSRCIWFQPKAGQYLQRTRTEKSDTSFSRLNSDIERQ